MGAPRVGVVFVSGPCSPTRRCPNYPTLPRFLSGALLLADPARKCVPPARHWDALRRLNAAKFGPALSCLTASTIVAMMTTPAALSDATFSLAPGEIEQDDYQARLDALAGKPPEQPSRL
jgi:hypothetical protein